MSRGGVTGLGLSRGGASPVRRGAVSVGLGSLWLYWGQVTPCGTFLVYFLIDVTLGDDTWEFGVVGPLDL